MLERSFGQAIRSFGTLFLLVAMLTVPLHLAYSLVFRNVIETRELHEVIGTFPSSRQVRGVGQTQLTQARVGLIVVSLIELAAIPWFVQMTVKVLRDEEEGNIATVSDAVRGTPFSFRLGPIRPGPVAVSVVVALLIGFLIERSGLLLLEFVSDPRSYPFFGLMQGVARAAGAPFVLATLAYSHRPKETTPKVPNVY
ncbi:MAG TPA: hypothetical protein VE174_03245 [Actinomycetota bacterium]|nr:hypothetical protein [Actinomycetota bacterium]